MTAGAVPVELEEDAADIAEVSQSEGLVMEGVNDAWSGVQSVGNQELSWWEYMRRFPPPPFMFSHPTQLIPSTQPTQLTQPLTQPAQPTQPSTQPSQPTQPSTQPTQPTQPSTQPTQPLTQPTQLTQPSTRFT